MKQDLIPKSTAKKTKVAIMGFSPSWRLAPFDEVEWEIWGMNELYKRLPRWDRWFELHKRTVNLDDEGSEHIWKLAALDCPVYMQKHYDDIPASLAYPLDKVTANFRPYLTSTFSFMVALAILEGFEEIGVYGCDTADEEWGSQRPSLEYFLGYAEGKGIKVTIPHESSLLRAPFIYGYQERHEQQFFGKLANYEYDYKERMERAEKLRDTYALGVARYEGAIDAIRSLRNEWRLPFQEVVDDRKD